MKISKYTQLNDRDWLHQKHIVEHLSTYQIAKIVGCNTGSVVQSLNRLDIPAWKIRSIKAGVSIKYPELNNREWLYDQYVVQLKSTNQIAQQIDLKPSCSDVSKALRRHDIPVRSKGDGLRLALGKDDYFIFNKPVIEGCLLGDGSFDSHNKFSDGSAPCFDKGNIGYDHLLFVASKIFGKNPESRIKYRTPNEKGFVNAQPSFHFSTLTHPELMPLYRAWYPPSNNYEKVVPDCLEITPEVLLHWFMDDGYSYFVDRKDRNKVYKRLRIMFSTECFCREDLKKLCEKVKAATGLTITVRFHQRNGEVSGTGQEIALSEADNDRFFEIIGPCPVPSMAYKWKSKTYLRHKPLSFQESREYVHSLKLKNIKEWTIWLKLPNKKIGIPSRPRDVYKDQWQGWDDWLGI